MRHIKFKRSKIMRRLTTLLLFTVMCFSTVCGQVITGSWKGLLDAGPVKLNIVFHFHNENNGSVTCKMDSPDQGAKGIVADVIHASADSVSVAIPSLGLSYHGRLSGSMIKGVLSQTGYDFALNLNKGNYVADRPQTPVASAPYKTEEVKFVNPGDGAVLAGTLTYPTGYVEGKSKEPVPVVLMVTGSGLQNRDEELFGHKPFLVIADYLAKNGIASLRYDDRAFGQSTGDAATATTKTFYDDAKSGMDYLRSLKKFSKIGVLGHSEGGTIAFMLGAGKFADFIISLAGAAVRGDKILVEQSRIAFMSAGVPKAETDAYCMALDKIYEHKNSGKACSDSESVVDGIIKSNALTLSGSMKESLKQVLAMDNVWFNHFISYNPEDDIRRVSCPVLALNGSLDVQVAASQNLPVIKSLLPDNNLNAVKEYPGLNHLFQHAVTGSVTEYNKISETISEEVLNDIVRWIKTLL